MAKRPVIGVAGTRPDGSWSWQGRAVDRARTLLDLNARQQSEPGGLDPGSHGLDGRSVARSGNTAGFNLLRPAGIPTLLGGATDRLQQRSPARKRVHARCEIGVSRSGCRGTTITAGRLRAPFAVSALAAGWKPDLLAAQHLHREHDEPNDTRSLWPACRQNRVGAFHEETEITAGVARSPQAEEHLIFRPVG
jgi:hypothetical protein